MIAQLRSPNLDRAVSDLTPIDLFAALPVAKISHLKGAVPLALIVLVDRRRRRSGRAKRNLA